MNTEVKIVGKECKFVTYVPPPEPGMPDLHVVKELIHYSDGTKKPGIFKIPNYQRKFWVTKKGQQNHKSKKEWEDINNLNEFKSTQDNLTRSIARALGTPWVKGGLKELCGSPYVYGSDILGTALIKHGYEQKYNQITATPHTVGVCDTETDVINGTGEVIMASFTHRDIVFTAVVRSFLQGQTDIEARLDKLMKDNIGEIIEKRNIKSTLMIVDNPVQAVIETLKVAHKVKPDFLAFWNMDFDISKILDACEKYNVDPKDVFSDPDLPPEYRYFKYKRGKDKKVTASGKITPVKPANRWHTVFTPASFYPIDAMCVYRHLRLAFQELQSYSLDFILNTNKIKGKLKFKEADKYSGLQWHMFMQQNYPLEYIVYNRYDCICVELLDEKTGDLSISLPMFSGYSDYQFFNSQPRRIVDDLHFEVLADGKVIGSTGKEMSDEDDTTTLDLKEWIITLPAHTIADNGGRFIIENPNIITNIHVEVGDLDVSASYPNGQSAFNISKETTSKEVIEVEGIAENVMRMENINLSGGQTNALEYCQVMLGFPNLNTVLQEYDKKHVIV